MAKTSLAELCKQLSEQGYTHAGFLTSTSLKKFWNDGAEPGNDDKPTAMYFSKLSISEIYDEETDEVKGEECVPEWYTWVKAEDFYVDSYGQRDILFIKVDEMAVDIINNSSNETIIAYNAGTDHVGRRRTNWNRLHNNGYTGAVIDNPHDGYWGKNACWDVATAVIWDKKCTLLKNGAMVFKSSGNSYEYASEPLSIEEYMMPDETGAHGLTSALQILHERLVRLIK